MFITVVVPVRNEERFIADTLSQLLGQDYPADRFEIIVVDGMSEDHTRGIVGGISRRNPNVRLIENQKKLSCAGRNIGFANGKGDVFLVVDGHCHIGHDRLFRNIDDCFRESGAECLGRPQPLDPPGITRFQSAVAHARASRLGHGKDSLIYSNYEGFSSPVSNGAAYKREVFEKIGCVDETFDACEDVEFNYRVEQSGMMSFTSPRLTVRYYPREDFRSLFRQMMRYGRGRYRLVKKHPESLSVGMTVPPIFVGVTIYGVICLLLTVCIYAMTDSIPLVLFWFSAASLLLFIIYVILLAQETIRISKKIGIWCLIYLPLIFITIHGGLGIGFIYEIIACPDSVNLPPSQA